MEAEENCASISPQTTSSAARERVASTAVNATSFSRPNKHEGLRFACTESRAKLVGEKMDTGGSEGPWRSGRGSQVNMINFQN